MRDSMPRSMIQQQMYARERRGIFRSTEGYDTVAKSSGLEPAYIKKVLHPFCVYDAPTELATRGEKDGSAYPETMHLLHLDNGDILLGRSVYKAVDFTGLRSAFFTHNYLIPAGHEDESADRYESWLRASFDDQYDIENGTELAELASLPTHRASAIKPTYRSTLALLNIGEIPFKQLLYAVMTAVGGGKKKIYVSLDVPIVQLPEKAMQLLNVIYASLPYAYRKQLGFITYAKEPQSRKGVHLTFVEQGSLRASDRSIEKDYTFDFASGRITNVDLDGADQPYLDFAWDNLERPSRADGFYPFAELMLADMGVERKVAAASYHELCVIYQIEEGNESLYEAHKSVVLRGLLDYLQPSGALNAKIRLSDVLLSRFDYEFDRVRQGQVPDAFIVDVFKEYYRIDGKYFEGKLVSFFLSALNNASRLSDQAAVEALYDGVESNADFSYAFFRMLIADSRLMGSLFISYLERKLQILSGAGSVLQLIEHWGSAYPKLFDYESFQALARQQLASKLERERYSLPAVNTVLEQLRRIEGESRAGAAKQHSLEGAAEFYQELELALYRKMLAEMNLDQLTKEHLLSARFFTHKEQLQRWNGKLQDPRERTAALKLLALYEWFAQPEPSERLFNRLSPAEIDDVQQAGRRLLEEQLEEGAWPRLVLAFLSSSDTEVVDYTALLDYLHRNAANKETVYRFFQWSEKQPEFMRPRGFVPAYITAIVAYFTKYDRDAFKKRANWKQHFDKGGPALQAVYKQAGRELSSKARFPFRNGKAAVISSIALLGIIMVVAGLLWSNSDKGGSGNEGAGLPEIQPSDETEIPGADVVVFAEQNPAVEGAEATTSLVFLFKNAAACADFKPTVLSIAAPGAEAVEYKEFGLVANCSTDTASPTAPAGDGTAADGTVLPTVSTTATGTVEPAGTIVPMDSEEQAGKPSASPPPEDQPTVTPVIGSQTDDTNVGETERPTDAAGSESDPTASAPEGSVDEQAYASRVEVSLGKKVDIPADSLIRVGETEYKLTALQVVAE